MSNHVLFTDVLAVPSHSVVVGATFFIEYSIVSVSIEYFFPTGFGSKRFASKGPNGSGKC